MEVQTQKEHLGENVAWLVGRMFLIPFRTMLYGMEMLVQAMRGFQRAGDVGMAVLTGPDAADRMPLQAGTTSTTREEHAFDGGLADTGRDNICTLSREKTAMDKNLNDDMLKLVRYKVLFVKRGHEHAFPEREALVWDNMDSTAFTAWKIAEFIQMLSRRDTSVPPAWGKSYPPSGPHHDKPLQEGGVLLGFPEEDKKYLRMFFEVLERYPREKLHYEERHLDILEDIRDEIGRLRPRQP